MKVKIDKPEIKEAFKKMTSSIKKGTFGDMCREQGHKGANITCINKALATAKRTGDTQLKKRAILARTFLKMRQAKAAKKANDESTNR